MTFQELQQSLHILGLEDRMTMQQIKDRHRELVKQYHPDSGNVADDGIGIQRINAAYQVIAEYLESYRFSFAEEEFYAQNPEENLRRQFMDDPVWGGVR
ncbi:MAG TPA: J domain-containing protein [Desulfuromonadales bacterium]|nr:J domain-containing protein [Desulfuromonadales bacterium]